MAATCASAAAGRRLQGPQRWACVLECPLRCPRAAPLQCRPASAAAPSCWRSSEAALPAPSCCRRPQASVSLSSQVASLQLELTSAQQRLLAKEASARKYKEAVRLLKVGGRAAWGRGASLVTLLVLKPEACWRCWQARQTLQLPLQPAPLRPARLPPTCCCRPGCLRRTRRWRSSSSRCRACTASCPSCSRCCGRRRRPARAAGAPTAPRRCPARCWATPSGCGPRCTRWAWT
jgi:hypothetical protein